MSFNASQWAARVTRISERRSLDSLDVDKAFAVAREIELLTRGWGMTEQTRVKVARKIVERQISPMRVAELIEAAIIRHKLPARDPDGNPNKAHVANRGGFVIASIKNELRNNGHAWNREEE